MPEKTIVVGTTEVMAVGYNPHRTVLTIINDHTTAKIQFSTVKGEASNGIPIFAQSGVSLQVKDGDRPDLAHYVVSDTANTNVRIQEIFEYAKKKI